MSTPQMNNVVVLAPRNTGRFAVTVTQDDLCELLTYSQALNEARDAYLQKRDWIRAALEAGATVEPGLHGAELLEMDGWQRMTMVKPFKKLVVR